MASEAWPEQVGRGDADERLIPRTATAGAEEEPACGTAATASREPAREALERGGSASEARWRIDEHAAGGPVVVLGDFNADPTSAEIQSMFCFSFAPEPSPASGRSHNRDRSVLRVFPPPVVTPAAGTYAWKTSHTQGPGFRLYDYFAAGPNLTVRQPRVLRKLGRTPLTDGTWPIASDHLPVAGTLDLP